MQYPLKIANRYFLDQSSEKAGGSASVYEATDILNIGSKVAVKLYFRQLADEDFPQEFFSRESEALEKLNNHPNIVKLLDQGYDDDLKKHYLVLEWIDYTLPTYLARIPADRSYDWIDIAHEIMLPVLKGLAYMHEKQVRHRDIKPTNILVSSSGTPMLADFAIAKIGDSLRPGLTVNIFATKDYAPADDPERRNYSSDLWALAISILMCLYARRRGPKKQPADINTVLSELNLPAAARNFFDRLLAQKATDRPTTASVALAELQRVLNSHEGSVKPALYIDIPPSQIKQLSQVANLSAGELYKVLKEDLSDGVFMRKSIKRLGEEDRYSIVGRDIEYTLKLDGGSQAYFVLLKSETQLTYSQLDRDRESSLNINVNVVFRQPSNFDQARNDLDGVIRGLAAHTQSILLDKAEQEGKKLFRHWENMLQALTDLNGSRLEPLTYQNVDIQDGRPTFEMVTGPGNELIGQIRRVTSGAGAIGTVLAVAGPYVTLDLFRGNITRIPSAGSLIVDATATEKAISRQRRALQAVKAGTAARPDLGNLLLHPDESRSPEKQPELVTYTEDLDQPKLDALRLALSAPDFAIVQGPPGTGKTTWIAELICQFLKADPTKNILLSAQTHTALDHALAKIEKLRPELQLLRVGQEKNIAETTVKYHISNRLAQWSGDVKADSKRFLAEWATSRGISNEHIALSADTNKLIELLRSISIQPEIEQTETEAVSGDSDTRISDQRSSRNEIIAHISHYIAACQRILAFVSDQEADLDVTVVRDGLSEGLDPLARDANSLSAASDGFSGESYAALADTTFTSVASVESAVKPFITADESLSELFDRFIDMGLSLASEIDSVGRDYEAAEASTKNNNTNTRSRSLSKEADDLRRRLWESTDADWYLTEDAEGIKRNFSTVFPKSIRDDLSQYQTLELLQRDWLKTFGGGAGFESALVKMSNVVAGTCVGIASVDNFPEVEFDLVIIDEASKATPTEALIALSRGRKWVLVGDNKQLPPFVDAALLRKGQLTSYDLTPDDLKQTLFDWLIEHLPDACKSVLSVQRRMVPAIGKLISHCFYEKSLETKRSAGMPNCLSGLLDTPVIWRSTSQLARRSETPYAIRGNKFAGFSNLCEAVYIDEFLKNLEREARLTGESLSVGVISGYKQQIVTLTRQLVPSDKTAWEALKIEVNTVDAFQGREVDVLVYSTTRSNKEGEIGFLSLEARLNVALSRGRDALIIVGDAEHFRFSSDHRTSPFAKVLKHIETYHSDCRLEVLT